MLADENEVVDSIRALYERTLVQPAVPAPENFHGKEVDSVFVPDARRTPALEREAVVRCESLTTRAIAALKMGNSVEAYRLLASADQIRASHSLGAEGRLFCRLRLAAAEAYVDYWFKNYAMAETRLLESFASAATLEREFGNAGLILHRIHMLNNVVRVKALAGKFSDALSLAHNLIAYTSGLAESIPSYIQETRQPRVPVEFWHIGTVQAFQELAGVTMLLRYRTARELWRCLFADSLMDLASKPWTRSVGPWYRLKTLFFSANHSSYLRACHEFLSLGPETVSPTFWIATVLDAAEISSTAPSGAGFEMRVLHQLDAFPSVPRAYRTSCVNARSGSVD